MILIIQSYVVLSEMVDTLQYSLYALVYSSSCRELFSGEKPQRLWGKKYSDLLSFLRSCYSTFLNPGRQGDAGVHHGVGGVVRGDHAVVWLIAIWQ